MTFWPAPRADGTALVKICGMRREVDVDEAIRCGADLLGVVFAPSRRQVTIEVGRRLVAAASGRVPLIGVFVNASVDEMNAVIEKTGIAAVQLSGTEPAERLEGITVPIVKTAHIREDSTLTDILHITNCYRSASAFCVDTWSPLGGGSGKTSDWTIARELVARSDKPVLLAGGLTAANVAGALACTAAPGVDVSSGVETDGWKDPDLMKAFVAAVRSAQRTITSDVAAAHQS
jgi:phosphoribosylanthranilate isomerase